MKKYIVYITHYTGNKLPEWYIGSSYEEKINNGYNGTVLSKKYKEIYNKEQKENKHLFKTKILSYHETSEEALIEELRLQKKHSVVKNDRYFNESYAQVNGMFGRDVSGELHPMYGKTHSKESRELISKNHIDVKGKNNPMYGKNHSEISKDKFGKKQLTIESNGKTKASNTTAKRIEKFGKHWNTYRVKIFNDNGEMIYNNLLSEIIKRYDIPIQAFRKSIKLNGEPIYKSKVALGSVKEKWKKYQNWYAIKE